MQKVFFIIFVFSSKQVVYKVWNLHNAYYLLKGKMYNSIPQIVAPFYWYLVLVLSYKQRQCLNWLNYEAVILAYSHDALFNFTICSYIQVTKRHIQSLNSNLWHLPHRNFYLVTWTHFNFILFSVYIMAVCHLCSFGTMLLVYNVCYSSLWWVHGYKFYVISLYVP